MNNVKITVAKVSRYDDLIKKYENPIYQPCVMVEGMVFYTDGINCPDNFCLSAWATLMPFARALAMGATALYDNWMQDPKTLMISCNDGFRPVSFLLEINDDKNG